MSSNLEIFTKDNLAYPIEIQLWCGKDYLFNVWSHKHTYKYKSTKIGADLYKLFEEGKINNEEDFLTELARLEDSNG
ncbi:MAG: hypothetical protein R3Y35_06720 [Clostridia bacterium]